MVKDKLIHEIKKYIENNGGMASGYGWYVGVTADPRRRLFLDHKVSETNGAWIYGELSSDREARYVEEHLHYEGCRGGSGGGGADARYVYAYRINLHTKE